MFTPVCDMFSLCGTQRSDISKINNFKNGSKDLKMLNRSTSCLFVVIYCSKAENNHFKNEGNYFSNDSI